MHQALRSNHRGRPQQERVEQAEDGGVEADAERRRRDHHGREARMTSHHPAGVAKIVPQAPHLSASLAARTRP